MLIEVLIVCSSVVVLLKIRVRMSWLLLRYRWCMLGVRIG